MSSSRFFGWATPLAALAGLVLLIASRRYGLASLLGIGALVPILLAVGTHFPLYSVLWHAFPPCFPRVPERLLPIACLCIAALAAFAVARTRSALVAVLALLLLFVDLHARVYGKSAPGKIAAASAAIGAAAPGRLLELPVFDPGIHYGSVYLWYDTRARRQRPGGIRRPRRRAPSSSRGASSGSTAATGRARPRSSSTRSESRRSPSTRACSSRTALPDRRFFVLRGLAAHGWQATSRRGTVWVFTRGGGAATRAGAAGPDRTKPVFCQGWYGNTGQGWPISETHAPFWVYGAGRLRLRLAAPQSLHPAPPSSVDGRVVRGSSSNGTLSLPLGPIART